MSDMPPDVPKIPAPWDRARPVAAEGQHIANWPPPGYRVATDAWGRPKVTKEKARAAMGVVTVEQLKKEQEGKKK